LFSAISTFAGLYVVSLLYQILIGSFGFTSVYQLAALPLLGIISGILGVMTRPIGSFISRKFEFEADIFAVKTTGNFDSFKSTMEKLAFQNLADEEPNKFVEFWFYSHPSIKRRILNAEKYIAGLSNA
jgi:STE24 endopeptidase